MCFGTEGGIAFLWIRGAEGRPGIFSAGADVAGGQDDSGQQSGGREGVRAGSA